MSPNTVKYGQEKNFVFSHFSRRIVLPEMLFHFLFGDKGREEELKVTMKGKNLKNMTSFFNGPIVTYTNEHTLYMQILEIFLKKYIIKF